MLGKRGEAAWELGLELVVLVDQEGVPSTEAGGSRRGWGVPRTALGAWGWMKNGSSPKQRALFFF